MNIKNSAPLHDRVLISVHPNKGAGEMTSTGGIIMAPTRTSVLENFREATVEAVGTGEILTNGTIRPLAVKVGDRVLVQAHEILYLQDGGKEDVRLGILSETSILCILPPKCAV